MLDRRETAATEILTDITPSPLLVRPLFCTALSPSDPRLLLSRSRFPPFPLTLSPPEKKGALTAPLAFPRLVWGSQGAERT